MGAGVRRRCAGRRARGRRRGKSTGPERGREPRLTPQVLEGEAAEEAVAEARRRTTSRRELSSNPRFEQISPDVGTLDLDAVDELLDVEPDEMLSMLADMSGATDPALRRLSRELSARVFLEIARTGPGHRRGSGRIAELPFRPGGGDLDIDASLDALAATQGLKYPIDPDGLRVRDWVSPGTAICLLVDRSGSMGGRPLATSAVAAAAVAWRAPKDYSVLAFARNVVAAKSQDAWRPPEDVVDAVLALRGFGTTDLAGALRAGWFQLMRSSARRRICILLSDCRATEPGDVVGAAAVFDE
ncbi:MAG: VWA domain-containing protein, partial [Ilumatobacteraceae bacterium]|nr:VWA domain-containing protein [Ilumatobacteraceae bacterium]